MSMPKPSQIIQFRQRRRVARQRSPLGRLGMGSGLLLSLGLVLVALVGLGLYSSLTSDLPSLETIPARLEPPDGTWLQPTRLYDRTETHILYELQDPGAEGWRYLHVSADQSPDAFSEALVEATIASVDPSFWENPGYSIDGWLEGTHPTLAQRLVLDILLSDEHPSLRRNLRERLLAGQLISRYGQEKAMEWYLNSVWYGPLVYGADAAARAYFGISASELTIAQAALLTAAAETPAINPTQASQAVLQRQQQIIAQMFIQGLITAEQARLAGQEELAFRSPVAQDTDFLAYTSLVIEQLSSQIPISEIERGGLRIVTTLDYDLQLQAGCTLEAQLLRISGEPADVLTADGAPCDAARLLPTLGSIEAITLEGLTSSLVVLDPVRGEVLVFIGQVQSVYTSAQQSGGPGGTLLTPFIYLTAFLRGFSPGTLIWDVPETGGASEIGPESDLPESLAEIEIEYHGPVRLRTALVNDYLGAAAQLYERVGTENTWQTARQFGFSSLSERQPAESTLSGFLNTRVTLLESVYAFSVFSNSGTQAGQYLTNSDPSDGSDPLSPSSLIRVEDSTGQLLLDWSAPQTLSVINPQLAYIMTHVLSDEAARWPSLGHPNPLEIGRPVGARLGASQDGTQVWTVGFVPQTSVGVWLSLPEAGSIDMPGAVAAGVWNAVIKYITRDLPVQDWSIPPGITSLMVCDPSGLLPTETCPRVVNEVFLQGSEPTQADNLYQVVQVNRETGLLATVFTPSELVESRVFLAVPAWAETWAEQSGLPVPPDGYDPIYAEGSASADASLSAPAMFDHISGQVTIFGSARGDNFAYYRLQIGQGLNPQSWILLGEDVTEPVTNGELGVWNSEGLQGLYVIQLLVVDNDQHVERSVLQVTVDNTPPEVMIMDPSADQKFNTATIDNILLQASASDDLVLEKIEFFIDGELVFTLWQPPYAGLWSAIDGAHTLLVRAYDLAGNFSEQVVRFEVAP